MNEAHNISKPAKLSEEDQARVDAYLNSSVHRYERRPFRPWMLMLVLTVVVVGLTVLSLLYAWQHGITAR